MGKENKSKYALLGMLSLAPLSGYEMKKLVNTSIGHFWNESYPQIYPMLKQLTQEGLTTSSIQKNEGRAESSVYRLTEQGWEELRHWLAEPFEYQIERNELLLKLFFGSFASIPINVEHIQRHRSMQAQQLHTYEQTEADIRSRWSTHPHLPYWIMTLSYGKHIAQAMIEWCDETLITLEKMASDEKNNERNA